MKLPHKLRHFTWKVGRNILATKNNLNRRKISADDECALCGQLEETTCPLLWFCKHACGVWESIKLALPFAIVPSWTFLDVMQNLQKWEGSQPSLTKKVISIFWGIWKDRNERRMGGKGKSRREILKTSLHLVEEYHAKQSQTERCPGGEANDNMKASCLRTIQGERRWCSLQA